MLIILEGSDASGKSTQFSLLCRALDSLGKDYTRLLFPQYENPSSTLVRMYLSGEFGKKPTDVNPYAASTFYAVDRYASMKQSWGELHKQGKLLVADRYTTSNAIHQASKLPEDEREGFFNWLFDFEYNLLELPKPDMVIFLDMPFEYSQQLLKKRDTTTAETRDIHEQDTEFLKSSYQTACLAAEKCGWQRVNCIENGQIRSIENIHSQIFDLVRSIL